MWGGIYPPKEIIEVAGVSRNTYNGFRRVREVLSTGRSRVGPYTTTELSILAYMHLNFIMESCTDGPGAAAAATSRQYRSKEQRTFDNLGILPVEILLRWRTMSSIYTALDITSDEFLSIGLSDADRAAIHMKYLDRNLYLQ